MMRFKAVAVAFCAILMAAGFGDGASAQTPNAQQVLADVKVAMGTEGLSSITTSGRAWRIRNGFRQTRTASAPWIGRDEIMNYVRTIDLAAPASRASGVTYAENLFFDPPTAGVYTQNVLANQTGWASQLNIWLTPWGFLKGAETNGATVSTVDGQTVLSWQSPAAQTSPSGKRYTVNAYINGDNLIERTETWVEDSFMGDMQVAATYGDYRKIDGVMTPGVMELWQGGGAIFGVVTVNADANPANLASLMAPPTPPAAAGGAPAGAPPAGVPAAAPTNIVQQLAPGVWQITGGYTALVVEFETDLVVFEAGQNEARGDAVLAAVKTISTKPIRAVVNSHPHSDHSGGLVSVARAGIPIIVSQNALDFQQAALSAPRTLLGQPLLNPKFQTVPDGGVMVIEDSMNRLELHHIPNLHTDSMLLGYLPLRRIAIQADFTLRYDADGSVPGPSGQSILMRELAQYVQAHGMQFDTMIGVHAAARQQSSADVLKALPSPAP